jgi:hypothetical protein
MSEEQIKMNYINDTYNMKIYIKLGTKTFQNAFGPKCFLADTDMTWLLNVGNIQTNCDDTILH